MLNHLPTVKFILLILLVCAFMSCHKSKLEQALSSSGTNRGELEKVLKHYSENPDDSLKLKAAYFLIENMLYMYTYESKDIDEYYVKSNSIFTDTTIHDKYGERIDTLLSLISTTKIKQSQDLKKIAATELISNIDCAFEMLKYPWCAKLSFDEFCEYVLPYKTSASPIENWRPYYKNKFSHVVDSVAGIDFTDTFAYLPAFYKDIRINEKDTCLDSYIDSLVKHDPSGLLVCRTLSRQFREIIHYPQRFKPALPPSLLPNVIIATCPEWTQLGIYTMRAFGLPVASDFTPNWGNRSLGHEWNSLILGDGKSFAFQMGETYFADHHNWLQQAGNYSENWKLAKVYRRTYQIQRNSLIFQNIKEDIPELFKNPYYIDVSHLYFEPMNISVPIETSLPGKQIGYIMAFDNQSWRPLDWGYIKGDKISFHNMAKGCMYMAMYYDKGHFSPLSSPFYIDEKGDVVLLKPDWKKTTNAKLIRKYTDKKTHEWAKRILRGRFQLANTSDFSDAITIHTIDSIPPSMYHTIDTGDLPEYRYVRYLAPDGSPGLLAELEVYGQDGEKMDGEIIGTEGSLFIFGLSDKYKVFDSDVLTFFEAEKKTGVWVGLKFKKKEKISKVVYLPRNDDNFIREGELYELFYWDNNKWNSLGQQIGRKATQELIYEVPHNALFRLRNLTKGMEERIFTYENDRQIWW